MKFLQRMSNGNGQAEQNGRSEALFTPNPYLAARRQWNSQIDRAFSSLCVWRLISLACLLLSLALAAGITYIGSTAKWVPYVIEVDKLGDTLSVGPARTAGPADPRVVRASLAAFISSARLVTPDQDLERKGVFTVFSMLKTHDPATVKMNEFFNGSPESSPFVRAQRITVNTEISTVMPITENAWQVDWQETTRDRDGGLVGKPQAMRATLQIYVEPPPPDARQEAIERNPLGIYVKDYNWQAR